MASSAFKSTSKRGNLNSSTTHNNYDSNSTPKTSPSVKKRSLSVSAISRARQSLDISSDFSNKRENPLFWASVSSPTDKESNEISAPIKGTEKGKERGKIDVESTAKKGFGKTAVTDQRGRSVTRNSGVKNGIGRSISRVRGRYVSRGHYGAYESEKDQELANVANSRSSDLRQVISCMKNGNIVTDGDHIREQIRDSQRMNSLCQANDCSEDDSACSLQISNWEDGISTCSLSEAEGKTVKTVCKQMKDERWGVDTSAKGIYETVRSEVRRAISDIQNDIESVVRRNNANAIANTSVGDIPSNFMNPGALEFLMDIRKQYARKLEESEDRARKLRTDLAVEEHHGQQLSTILQEILPDPKTSNPQRSRMGRKRSNERKRISKRLTEEAMAYFDECVSISTFDSSDFSASDDLPCRLAGPPNLVSGTLSVTGGSSTSNLPLDLLDSCSNNPQVVPGGIGLRLNSYGDSNLTANSGRYDEPTVDQVDQMNNGRGNSEPHQFSFAQKAKVHFKLNDIKSYIKHFERAVDRNTVNADVKGSNYNTDEHDLHGRLERLLFDRVFFRNRIESGGLHLCAGNLAVSFSPFGSVV